MSESSNNAVATATGQTVSQMPFCGPPPLRKGEDGAAYNDLLARVSGRLNPTDIFEEIWVSEIVALIWESARWRGDLVGFLNAALATALERVITPLLDAEPAAPARSFVGQIDAAFEKTRAPAELMRRWTKGEPEAIKRVEALLASANLTLNDVAAQATAAELSTVERLNHLIANVEWRRNRLLDEIERHRSRFAKTARQAVEQIEDAEFEAIEANAVEANTIEVNAIKVNAGEAVEAKTAMTTKTPAPASAPASSPPDSVH
jgi:hypothetical protein